MRAELERTKRIEEYLLGKLNAKDKQDFIDEMNADPELANEVELQRVVMQRVNKFAIQKKVSRAHTRNVLKNHAWTKYIGKRRFFLMSMTVAIAMLVYSVYDNSGDNTPAGFIHPPLGEIDVPFVIDSICGDSASVMQYKSGAMVLIPDSAFANNKGELVLGNVELRFREFSDATDIYLSGIPMEVKINGENYPFESAAMCEIYASQNGKQLRLRTGKHIEIVQKSYTTSDAFNLYQFDKNTGVWGYKGKDVAVEFTNLFKNTKRQKASSKRKRVKAPIKPREANGRIPNFSIEYQPNEFPELVGFENAYFEVDESVNKLKAEDSAISWEGVKIERAKKRGFYRITFSKKSTKQEAQYVVYPVFKGIKYDDALKVYNQKLKEYKHKYAVRKDKEQAKLEAEKRRRIAIDKAIEQRRKEQKEQNSIVSNINESFTFAEDVRKDLQISALVQKRLVVLRSPKVSRKTKLNLVFSKTTKKAIRKVQKLIETEWKRLEVIRKEKMFDNNMRNSINRVYQADGFGIWNIDTPSKWPTGMNLKSSFAHNDIQFKLPVVLIDKSVRGIYRYSENKFNKFKYNPQSENLIWVVNEKQLYYFNKFSNIPKKLDGKAFRFEMTPIVAQINDYSDLRKALSEL